MTDQNLNQFKGENQRLNFTVTDDDDNPIDLTAPNIVDVHLDVATGLNRYGELKFEKTGTNLADDGTLDFTINATDTEDFRPGNYLYEVWVEFGNQENYTAEVGKFFLKPRVDR